MEQEELRKKFNPEGSPLRRQQIRALEILIYFDQICKANDIRYWLCSGTLLGAVRHQGFIPWDDDIDVDVPQEDFERLIKILAKDNMYQLQTAGTDDYYVSKFVKLRDTHSRVIEHGMDKKFRYTGIYIDIFPIAPSYRFVADIMGKLNWRLWRFSITATTQKKRWLFFLLKKLYFFVDKGLTSIMRYMPGAVGRLGLGCGFVDNVRRKEEIFPLSTIIFEGYEFLAPHNIDAYLSRLYGDYMKIPELSEIKIHTTIVDFFDDDDNY